MATKYSIIPEAKGIITEKLLIENQSVVNEVQDGDTNHDVIVAKVTAIVVLGICSFVIGLLPVKLAKWFNWKITSSHTTGHSLVISLLLCFGGGVLMFTTFLHLQPEVREAIDHLIKEHALPEYCSDIRLADLIFCMGFFFVYLIEEVVHYILDRKHDHNEDEAFLHRTMSLRRCSKRGQPQGEEVNPAIIPRVTLNHGGDGKQDMMAKKSMSTQVLLDSSSISTIHDTSSTANSSFLEQQQYTAKFSPLDPETQIAGGIYSLYGKNDKAEEDRNRKYYPEKTAPVNHHSHTFYETDSNFSASGESVQLGKTFRGFFTVLALSFHAVFEGLAVGLVSEVKDVWYLFLAIATHKFVISFCVGVDLLSTQTRMLLIVIYLATFAFVSPLGIGIGIALSEDAGSSGNDPLTLILQGMAGGTLLYVVFFEVLQREKANSQSGLLQLIAIMAGFGVMFALQLITGHDHDHSHHAHAASANVSHWLSHHGEGDSHHH
ncbi:UNVERIFIED_CONTAM: hypothetical protein PYX00_002143 [Menopon gallinae]|uniref:Zinc transporter ZIP1 n=1 Tax=Menopon gallinae TaxID=328185 RepID=A0AAW2IGY8_9NEOP